MTAAALSPYRVEAFNTAKASENKIHDDAVKIPKCVAEVNVGWSMVTR